MTIFYLECIETKFSKLYLVYETTGVNIVLLLKDTVH